MKKILIIVDMLNDFIKKDGKLYCGASAEAIVNLVKEKAEEYVKNEDWIFFLADGHEPDDLEFKRFPEHCVNGSFGSELIKELNDIYYLHDKSILIYKTRYSGFYKTGLHERILSIRPDLVEVVGVCTSICVMDTVGGLANRDYNINIYKNMIADFDPYMHKMAIERMKSLYGANII
jgi:nicotinamidase/pyrazinamidase